MSHAASEDWRLDADMHRARLACFLRAKVKVPAQPPCIQAGAVQRLSGAKAHGTTFPLQSPRAGSSARTTVDDINP